MDRIDGLLMNFCLLTANVPVATFPEKRRSLDVSPGSGRAVRQGRGGGRSLEALTLLRCEHSVRGKCRVRQFHGRIALEVVKPGFGCRKGCALRGDPPALRDNAVCTFQRCRISSGEMSIFEESVEGSGRFT